MIEIVDGKHIEKLRNHEHVHTIDLIENLAIQLGATDARITTVRFKVHAWRWIEVPRPEYVLGTSPWPKFWLHLVLGACDGGCDDGGTFVVVGADEACNSLFWVKEDAPLAAQSHVETRDFTEIV